MDDIIIIVLTIVFLAISLIGQNKKSKKKLPSTQQTASDSQKEPSLWETLFEELGMPQTSKKPQAEPEPFLDFENKTSRLRTKNIVQEVNTPKPAKEKIIRSEKLQSRKLHPLMKDFSLKKALVYSEIMNPKYITD